MPRRGAAIGGLPRHVHAVDSGMVPERAGSRPMSARISVLLPTPLRPSTPTISPALTSMLTLLQHVAGGVARAQAGGGDQRVHRSGLAEIDASHVLMRGDLIDRPLSEYAALMQHRDPLRDLAHESDVVLDDDDCQAARIEVLKQLSPVCSVSSGDMPAVGSSSRRTSGPAASTMAISSHCS